MSERRIVDIGELLDELRAQLDKESDHPTAWCSDEAIADEVDTLEALPTLDPKELLSMLWRDTKANPPTEEDAGPYGKVVVWYKGALEASTAPWNFPASMPECYPYWMPLPEPPEEVRHNAER